MRKNNRLFGFVHILITYIIVKIIHKLAGFHYNLFNEDIISINFFIDIMSWVIIYGITYFIIKKLFFKEI